MLNDVFIIDVCSKRPPLQISKLCLQVATLLLSTHYSSCVLLQFPPPHPHTVSCSFCVDPHPLTPSPRRRAVLVLVVILYRRRHVRTLYKEPVDEMRDTIINYDDEGGGEKDQTGYDLSVLQVQANGVSPSEWLGTAGKREGAGGLWGVNVTDLSVSATKSFLVGGDVLVFGM